MTVVKREIKLYNLSILDTVTMRIKYRSDRRLQHSSYDHVDSEIM